MSGTSKRARGYDRDPRRTGASTAYDPYPASFYTGDLTARSDQPAAP